MALSEDEQRILSEIEANLYETDPELAEEVRSTTVFRHGFRNLRRSVLGFIAGIVFMIFTLSTSFWLSFVGFPDHAGLGHVLRTQRPPGG